MNSEELDGILSGADFSALPPRGEIVVGFSGGADSAALAHSLMGAAEKERIVLAHVNHMLRGEEADRDEAAAREFARERGLRFALLRADVKKLAKERKMGIEECGRSVRYEFFESLSKDEESTVLTAHNADDNVETILMNITKGTAISGLCGIPYVRGNIIRPLLRVSRAEIEKYCAFHSIAYVQDSSNFTDEYERNRVRHAVIPVLRELNPKLCEAIARTALSLSSDCDFIDSEARKLLAKAEVPGGLSVEILNKAHEALSLAALRIFLLNGNHSRLERKHLMSLRGLLGKNGSLSLPGCKVNCFGGVLSVACSEEKPPFEISVFEGENQLPNGKILILEKKKCISVDNGPKINNLLFKNTFDYATITKALSARSRKAGDAFAPVGRHVTKTMKRLFQEMKILPSARNDTVLLVCGEEIVFCEGVGVSEKFCVTEKTEEIISVRVMEAEARGKVQDDTTDRNDGGY